MQLFRGGHGGPFARHSIALPFSIIFPANNEAPCIGACLTSLLAQDESAGALDPLVSANVCRDATVEVAGSFAARFEARGWRLRCFDDPPPGKTGALERAEAAATAGLRAFLGANVTFDPDRFGQLRHALEGESRAHATGRAEIVPAKRAPSRAPKPGCGGSAPSPRPVVSAPEGQGIAETGRRSPALPENDARRPGGLPGLLAIALRYPIGTLVYAAVHVAVRLAPAGPGWARGR